SIASSIALAMGSGKFDRTLTSFLLSMSRAILLILLFLSIARHTGLRGDKLHRHPGRRRRAWCSSK
ncbi:hypothetical protein, partial [Klebsiella aerogenes]|uniref:hypothetical protein n=1 Tax=Klebsiella aerogenes TaxID=548 RepID=UPI001952A45D